MAQGARFDGFPRALPKFLSALGRNNDREWFQAHRADYEVCYLEPAQAFVAAIAPELKKLSKGIVAEPRVNGSIMRINRDTRFSKDKTPYKTGLHLIFRDGGKAGPGFFLRIAPGGFGLAGGMMAFDPKQLERFRRAVIDPGKGRALREAVEKVRKAGPYELGEPALKRVPKGYDPEHPNAAFLEHKGFGAMAELDLPDALFGPKAVPYVIERFRELRPIEQWLVKALA